MVKQFFLILSLILSSPVWATPKIAVLDFELDDMTQLPRIPAELARTASFKPLLEQELQTMNYQIVQIDKSQQQRANAGVEYLLQHDDSSAELGERFGADWIIVAKHRKPSFLYSHLIVHVIPVKKRQSFPSLLVELKGTDKKVTEKSIRFLAEKIQTLINTQQQE
ncbi:hypothetical protein BROC_02317 [Candidatus Brocadiaceae bacterium]|nr:hypothetical protein BROC_02317 [Candidatus Brocadiaceae bacterium]